MKIGQEKKKTQEQCQGWGSDTCKDGLAVYCDMENNREASLGEMTWSSLLST